MTEPSTPSPDAAGPPKETVTTGSDNVFRDLGLDRPEQRLAEADWKIDAMKQNREHTHRCRRCHQEFACQTPGICEAQYDVLPVIVRLDASGQPELVEHCPPISPLSSSGRTPEPSEVRRTTERAKLETMIRYPKIRSLVDAAIWGNGSRKDLLDALHTIRRELP